MQEISGIGLKDFRPTLASLTVEMDLNGLIDVSTTLDTRTLRLLSAITPRSALTAQESLSTSYRRAC